MFDCILYLCVACGLRCYSCMNADSKSCTKIATCSSTQNCFSSLEAMGKSFFQTRRICSCMLTFQIDCLSQSKLTYFCSFDIVETNCMSFSLYLGGLVTKDCIDSAGCIGLMKCSEGDLCIGAIPTGSSVLLLLVSSAITSVFLWNSGEYSAFFFVNLYNSGKQLWLKTESRFNKITVWLTFVLFNFFRFCIHLSHLRGRICCYFFVYPIFWFSF